MRKHSAKDSAVPGTNRNAVIRAVGAGLCVCALVPISAAPVSAVSVTGMSAMSAVAPAPALASPHRGSKPALSEPRSVRADAGVEKRIAEITEPYANSQPPGPGATMQELKAAVAVSRQVTAELQRVGDIRGIFGVGLDTVEALAVVPYEENSSAWARVFSANLIYRYLSAVHAEFTGGVVPAQWQRYFDAATSGELSPEQVAMFGYNAHLTVDLALSVADSAATVENWPEYVKIVGLIADCADAMLTATRESYGVDLMPIWQATAVTPPAEHARGQVVRLGDQAYSTISYTNGLGIANPQSREASMDSVKQLWAAVDAAITAYR